MCLLVALFGVSGCKEKTELRELCTMVRVGDRTFESESLRKAVDALRRAEEAEEIAATLEKRRKDLEARHKAALAANLEERRAAEAIPMDQKEARRQAILDVTAKEQEAQKLSDEIAKYHIDIERNDQTAARARKAAAEILDPLLKKYGLSECQVLKAGKAQPAR